MLDLAGEHKLLVISDEIYDQIRIPKISRSTAFLAKDIPVVGLNGFSQVYRTDWLATRYIYFKAEATD